jgi:hypothetical protein
MGLRSCGIDDESPGAASEHFPQRGSREQHDVGGRLRAGARGHRERPRQLADPRALGVPGRRVGQPQPPGQRRGDGRAVRAQGGEGAGRAPELDR